jgi:hypothetical protein
MCCLNKDFIENNIHNSVTDKAVILFFSQKFILHLIDSQISKKNAQSQNDSLKNKMINDLTNHIK